MWRISRSASDGRFDSATSLVPSRQYSSRNPSSTPSSPVDSQVTKPIVSYSALKLSQPTETGSYLSSRSPAAPKSISSRLRLPHYLNKVVPLLGPSFPSQTHLASDDTSSLASSDTLASGTANRLSCKVCGATFTGKYGRGNRGRHMRQYHTQAAMTSFKCPVEGCPKTFARQDARLKHQRTHHSELHPNSSASPINLGEVPVSISTALCNIRTKLDDEAYAQLCDMFLYLFPRIVQYLRDTGSNTYDVYMDVLKEIVLVVDEIESDSIDSINQVMVDPALLSHPPHHSGAASANKGKGSVTTLGPNSMSRMDSNHPSRGQKLTHGQKHGSYKVAKGHQNESPPSRLVDCPDHKHHVMDPESRTSPCHGCRVKNMAQVRHHLRRINHQGRPGTWKCPFCKKDFNHERTMDEHIEAKSCQTQVQSRGDIVKPWAMLYLTRHPDAQRIPSPYCDEREWLSQSMWAECRASLQDTPTPMQDTTTFVPDTAAPFSGFIENATRGQDHEMVHSNNTPAESSQAAEHFATQLVNSMFSSMSNNHSTALTSNSTVGFNGNHQLGQNPPLYYTATQHGLLVQNLARRLVSIAQSLVSQAPGTMHVEMGQISPIATEAETVVNNTPIHNQFQLPHVQPQLQDDSNSAVNLPAPLFLGSSNIETSDFWSGQHETTQNESFRTQHSNQYSTPTLSTHSSQTDVPTDSYLTQPSPITNPSSAYGMTDRMLHSASNSPHHYRRGSGNSDVSDCPIPPRMQPDPQGLLGTNSQFEDAPSIEPERPEPFEFAEFIDPRILTMLNAETDMSQL